MKKYIPWLVPLGVVLGINLFFRAYPVYFPQLKKQAESMVLDAVRRQVQEDVYRKFPQYDPLANERLVNEQIGEYKKFNKANFNKQVNDLYANLKSRFQDDTGQTYLMELDCWHWARYVKNVVDHGYPGDTVRNGKQFDLFMMSPVGDPLAWNQFNFYFPAFLYKLFSIVRHVELFTFIFYLPLFYTAILITLLYFFAYRLGGVPTAVLACLFAGLSGSFMPRSCAGWFDMDVLNLIFPVAILWTYLQSREGQNRKKQLVWLGVSAVLVGLFCFTWINWWFIYIVILAYEVIRISYRAARSARAGHSYTDFKQDVITLGVFAGGSIVASLVFCGVEPIAIWLKQIRESLVLNKPLLESIWPNVFSTVGELRRVNFMEISQSMGGPFLTIASLLCAALMLIRAFIDKSLTPFKRASVFLLMLWFAVMTYATYRGVRFIMFLIIPLGIFLGWGIRDGVDYLLSRLKERYRLIALTVIVVGIGFMITKRGHQIASSMYPLMHDRWYQVLQLIKEKTTPDTTVNSWWDFGDWFKVVAERKVIFDGQTQNKPQAYWMGRALLSGNENESVGILRMLNNGGNKAFEIINGYINDPLQSALLLETVLPLDAGSAKARLRDFLPDTVADQVLLLLFDTPLDAEFLVDYSLVSKITAISYLGNWNFAKVYIVQNSRRMEKDKIIDYLTRLGKDPSQMQKYYQEAFLIPEKDIEQWISRPVQFFSEPVRGQQREQVVLFDNGFIYNPEKHLITANNGQLPRSVFYKNGGALEEMVFPNPNLVFSCLVWETQDKSWRLVLLDPSLGRSLFTRLYFLGGFGLRHFQERIKAYEGENFIGTYKINW